MKGLSHRDQVNIQSINDWGFKKDYTKMKKISSKIMGNEEQRG